MFDGSAIPVTDGDDQRPIVPSCLKRRWGGIGAYYACSGPHESAEHAHSEVQISIPFRHGRTARQESSDAVDVEISIVASNHPHNIKWATNADVLSFYLYPSYITSVVDDGAGASRASEIVERKSVIDPFVYHIGLSLLSEFRTGGEPGSLYLESLVNVLAAHLRRNHSATGERIPQVGGGLAKCKMRRAIEFINDHLEDAISLADVASSIGLSSYHFVRQFKSAMGRTPHQYQLERRIERAKELLADTNESIVEVALRLGFSNQSHFTAVFRKHAGITPKHYRKIV